MKGVELGQVAQNTDRNIISSQEASLVQHHAHGVPGAFHACFKTRSHLGTLKGHLRLAPVGDTIGRPLLAAELKHAGRERLRPCVFMPPVSRGMLGDACHSMGRLWTGRR